MPPSPRAFRRDSGRRWSYRGSSRNRALGGGIDPRYALDLDGIGGADSPVVSRTSVASSAYNVSLSLATGCSRAFCLSALARGQSLRFAFLSPLVDLVGVSPARPPCCGLSEVRFTAKQQPVEPGPRRVTLPRNGSATLASATDRADSFRAFAGSDVGATTAASAQVWPPCPQLLRRRNLFRRRVFASSANSAAPGSRPKPVHRRSSLLRANVAGRKLKVRQASVVLARRSRRASRKGPRAYPNDKLNTTRMMLSKVGFFEVRGQETIRYGQRQ